MNRNSILALALVFLVVLMLPLYVDAQQFPTGAYKYRAKRVSSREERGAKFSSSRIQICSRELLQTGVG